MKFRETCEVNSLWTDTIFHQSPPGNKRAHKISTTIADGRGEPTTQLPDGRSFFARDTDHYVIQRRSFNCRNYIHWRIITNDDYVRESEHRSYRRLTTKSLLPKHYADHCFKNSPQSRKQRHKDLIGALNSSHCRLTDIPVTYSAAARSKPQPGTSYPEFLWFYSVPPRKCQSGSSN
jgi:hypothetical protein